MKNKIFLLILGFFLISQSNPGGIESGLIQKELYQEKLKHEVTVVVKLIQVYVIDKEGNPVMDLDKSDFEVYDNGKLKKITEFEKHTLSSRISPKLVRIEKTKLPQPRRLNRKFILFFDFAFNSAQGIRRSQKAALHFIQTYLLPTDEVSVISYSAMRRLTLHLDMTTDHHGAWEIVKGFGLEEVLGATEKKSSKPRTGESLGLGKDVYRYQVINFTETIKNLAKALRYIQGQKQMVFFSSGVIDNVVYDSGNYMRDVYEEMIEELAASNCSVYSVYTGGSDSDMEEEIDRNSHLRERKDSDTPLKDIREKGIFPLERLSKVTGGEYFGNVNRYQEIMEKIQNITGSYYVLGYYIDKKWDGKYHKIKVKVKRKGCQVRAQGGYFNPIPFSDYSEFEKELHLIGLALNKKSDFKEIGEFPLVALPCSGQEKDNIVLISEINKKKLRHVISEKTEIITLIFDTQNNIVGQIKREVDLTTIPKKKICHYTITSLMPGLYQCRVVLRNPETGRAAVASSSVSMNQAAVSGLKLYPPFILVPEKEACPLFSGRAQEEKESEMNALKNIYPFLSENPSPLFREIDPNVSKFLAVIKCSYIQVPDPEIELSSYLLEQASGETIPLSFSILSLREGKGLDTLLLEIQLPRMEPGEYTLFIAGENIKTKKNSQVTRDFTVR